jgi:predicted amidophosphoribosyltransferase
MSGHIGNPNGMIDHVGDANKLVCPHCGLPADRQQNGIQGYRCGSSYCESFKPQWARSMTCLELENGQLQDRIERLKYIIDRAANRFFADGSDGKIAAEMLVILEERHEAKP